MIGIKNHAASVYLPAIHYCFTPRAYAVAANISSDMISEGGCILKVNKT